MLKTSPILTTTSANASPSSFRYAPPSPQNSSKPPSAIRRRPSSRSLSAASARDPDTNTNTTMNQRLQYVAMDHGAQPVSVPVPMPVPVDDSRPEAASLRSQPPPPQPHAQPQPQPQSQQPPPLSAPQPSQQPPTPVPPAPPQSPCPQPMTASSAASSVPSVEPISQQPPAQNHTQCVSPVKRRGSPGPSNHQRAPARAETSETGPSQIIKRPKPDAPPPKVLPQRYEFCPVEDMVELIAHMLAELIATNDAIRISNGGLTRFHSRTAPGISVRDYLQRLARHATLTPPLLLAMVYYIDRLCAMYPEFTINTLTVHRFLITAATVAAKGLSDSFWNNTTYARVGGVRVAELKLLELEFLYRVDWKIVPNPEVLVQYYKGLVERTPGYVLESDGTEEDEEEMEEDDDDPEEQADAKEPAE